MIGRPRCREWTPLTTQQLRLRSLIQIVGYNIRPPESCKGNCSYYLTLHHTTMSAPFYTSERISSPHPKWKEIDSEITHRMSSTNVVIRIWCHSLHANKDKLDKSLDTIIETWGVYFSGLRYIGANLASNFTSDYFKSNTLVFQMHGGYFCSYKSLNLDAIPPENEVEYGSVSSDSSGKTDFSKMYEQVNSKQGKLKESRSVSPSKFSRRIDKEYSKSQSPVDSVFKQNFPSIRTSASLNISHKNSDPQQIYEQKPNRTDVEQYTTAEEFHSNIAKMSSENSDSNIDLSESAEHYEMRAQADIPKCRYKALNFLKSEIRQSYNASKLQRLHLMQYSIKKRQDSVQEIKESIFKKSAMTNETWSEPNIDSDSRLRFKIRSQRNLFSLDDSDAKTQSEECSRNGKIKEDKPPVSNGPRLTLKLNDLLSYKTKPSPFQRAEHVRLTKHIEVLRFKRIILSDERDSKLASIRKLKETHSKLCEENQDVGLELMQNYHALSRRNETLRESRQSCEALRELAARTHAALSSRRCDLMKDLLSVFHIEQHSPTIWHILNIPLPICSDENNPPTTPSDSIAAGYVAQVTCLASALLNQPLRYKILLMGSASKIVDTIPVFNDHNIPLFVRSGDVTLFRYGLFLLNKCIAQLLWGRGIMVADIGPTLANLYKLLTLPSNLSETSKLFGTYHWLSDSNCPKTQSLRSLVASEKKYRQFNRFKDAVDGQSPESALIRRHRHSRSVGSYHDDQELPMDTSTTSIMGSEPNIYNTKLTQENLELQQRLLTSHNNSDSEISRISETVEKVTFTLGDDSSIEIEPKLVRISSNNDDVTRPSCHNDSVKRICSQINDFCLSNSSNEEFKASDEAGFFEGNTSVDVSCDSDSCQKEKDGCGLTCVSEVTDVIIIASAEAALDIGQS